MNSEPVIRVPVRVHFFDTDAGGVVHNIAYLRMVEVGRGELAHALGWSLAEMMQGTHGCPVVSRTEVDYLKPAKLGDSLIVESRLVAVERVRFWIETLIRRDGEETILCRARQALVAVNLQTGRPVKLRGDWAERWPHLCG